MRLCVLPLAMMISAVGLVHCSSDPPESGDPSIHDDKGGGGAEADSGTTVPSTDDPSDPGAFGGDAGQTGDSGACLEDIDVVFVLDVSSSMGFVLDKLGTEIPKVFKASNDLKSGAHFGLVAFVDNVKIYDTGDQASGKVYTTASPLSAAFQDANDTYTKHNRNPGDGPTGPETQNPICEENSLDALYDTAHDFPWRSNAARLVILATDDTFLEKPDNYGDRDGDGKTDKTSYPREGDYPARSTVAETVALLKQQQIRVFSFTRLKAPGIFDATKCGTGRRHASDDAITNGWTTPYGSSPPIPNATGGKNFDLDAVRAGKVSLADTINEVVLASHCAGPPK